MSCASAWFPRQTNLHVHLKPNGTPDGAPVHYERHRSEQTMLYRLVQQHAATFFTQAESAAGADPAQFVKDEFDAFLECGILAHGFLRLCCGNGSVRPCHLSEGGVAATDDA